MKWAWAKLLAEALNKLGVDGSLSFQLGNGLQDELDIVEGIHYPQGFLSPYFMTDKNQGRVGVGKPLHPALRPRHS